MALQCVHDVYVVKPTVAISRRVLPWNRQEAFVTRLRERQHRILIIVDENEQSRYAQLIDVILNNAVGSHIIEDLAGGLRIVGTLDRTTELIRSHQIDTVIILLTGGPEIHQLIADLYTLSLRILVAHPALNLDTNTAGQLSLVDLSSAVLSQRQRLIKRWLDILLSIPLIILLLPLMLLIALAIRLDSPGPAIFKQVRLGQYARPFLMYKFRSMRATEQPDDDSKTSKIPNDPRITRVGAFIRQTSLDEIPQLFNVLKGDMSLVGPRPELPGIVHRNYESWQYARFTVPQGATGWWQINGRSTRPMHLHTEDDLHYIEHYSLLLDLRILLRTIPVVIWQEGAY